MIDLRNQNGITFIILATTIIVILILALVSVNLGLEGVDNSADKQEMSILYMVQESVLNQYTMARSLGVADKKVGEIDQPTIDNLYYGEKIMNINDIATNELVAKGQVSPFPDAVTYANTIASTDVTNEDYYYRVKTADLKKLKIIRPGDSEDFPTTEETVDTYIINYKTGEVYNETKQITQTNDKMLYIKGKTMDKVKPTDDTSFVD